MLKKPLEMHIWNIADNLNLEEKEETVVIGKGFSGFRGFNVVALIISLSTRQTAFEIT